MHPEELLLAAFWKCICSDLAGRGCTLDSRPYAQRRLSYAERVTLERVQLQDEARQFIDSPDFQWWADQSGLDSILLRTKLYGY
ncbi:hypothetical protein LCGC14_0364050 [marine sediment metagenome]|uniref:Uncharacterized protein n=1 Tax=marine sediment metagenome TaxID=412755 RepID=A0A0F9VUC2_9ZZZZ